MEPGTIDTRVSLGFNNLLRNLWQPNSSRNRLGHRSAISYFDCRPEGLLRVSRFTLAKRRKSRRDFLKAGGTALAAGLLASRASYGSPALPSSTNLQVASSTAESGSADYSLHIAASPIEIAPKHFVSTITYNRQFPGPLLRFKEGQPATIEIHNDTDTPEQLHWHGQKVSTEVDGAAEEGTPFIPAHGMRRITFTPQPAGLRFYHTHNRASANLYAGQYSGQVGPVYIEPKNNLGNYDREVFLVLKEFEPSFSQGGDMPQNFLAAAKVKELEDKGESAMKTSLAKGMPHGFEVGYRYFTINGRMLGHGEPVRVKQGERVLFHILNGSATEIRSLALPGHSFQVVALDGNPVPHAGEVPVLWLGTAERISAIVHMTNPGVWVMGDLADDDRSHGMGIVVEYAGHKAKPVWTPPKPFHWNYARFGNPNQPAPKPDEVIEMTFTKQNAAEHGFNLWAINDVVFPSGSMTPAYHLHEGRRYRLRMRNASDDIHPIHLHRHSFEITKFAGKATSGVVKYVVMLGGYQEMDIDFTADNPGLTLFHCHQQLHMDFGFMTLFDYV
jgi:FtsP/CotA-like multicopper oxidase with cupredoxin domain